MYLKAASLIILGIIVIAAVLMLCIYGAHPRDVAPSPIVRIGMRRSDIERIPSVFLGIPNSIRNGNSCETVEIAKVLYIATFEINGSSLANPDDVLVDLERYEEATRNYNALK